MKLRFRFAKQDDAEALVKIAVEAFHHDSVLYPGIEIGGPPGYDSVPVMEEKINCHECYKIVEEKRIIVVFDKGNGHFHLDLIFNAPDFHSRGIGTKAMQFIESKYSATKWRLDTPTWAVRNIHFYEKVGYVKIHTFTEEDGTPLIAYEKRSSKT